MLVPAAPAYLTSTYASKPGLKGGTLIAEDVADVQAHRERLKSPDGYRPETCRHCGRRPHALGLRSRSLRDQPDRACEDIRRYRCRPCRAVWQVMPAFLARYLHRTWGAIQSRLVAAKEQAATGAEWRVRSKPTTLARWVSRLRVSATILTQALAEVGHSSIFATLQRIGIGCNRVELVEALASDGHTAPPRKLEELACWIHRLAPGLRLM